MELENFTTTKHTMISEDTKNIFVTAQMAIFRLLVCLR